MVRARVVYIRLRFDDGVESYWDEQRGVPVRLGFSISGPHHDLPDFDSLPADVRERIDSFESVAVYERPGNGASNNKVWYITSFEGHANGTGRGLVNHTLDLGRLVRLHVDRDRDSISYRYDKSDRRAKVGKVFGAYKQLSTAPDNHLHYFDFVARQKGFTLAFCRRFHNSSLNGGCPSYIAEDVKEDEDCVYILGIEK